jgi:hypothetical protein
MEISTAQRKKQTCSSSGSIKSLQSSYNALEKNSDDALKAT